MTRPRVTVGVSVPLHLLPVLAVLAHEGLQVVARRDGTPGPEAAELVADLLAQARRLRPASDVGGARRLGSTPLSVSASDVGGVAGRGGGAPASSGGMTSTQLAEALGLGRRHAADVARAAGVRSWVVGRSVLWDSGDVAVLARGRRSEGVA